MDSGQSARTGALLGLRGAGAVGALGAGQDAAGGDDQDVAVGELLLKLAGEALLRLVPALEGRDRDEDDDRLATVANLNLRILVSAFCYEAAQCPPPLRLPCVCVYVCVGCVRRAADVENESGASRVRGVRRLIGVV